MARQTPGALFPGYTVLASGTALPADSICIPLTALPNLSDAELDETTGSGAKLLYELNKVAEANFNAIPEENRTTRMTIARGFPAGVDENTIALTYTNTFNLDIGSADVASEA